MHQRGQRHFPAFAHRTQTVRVFDADIGEEDFVKLTAARHLLDRADFDTRGLHVDDEHGQALMLGHGRVGAGHHNAKVRQMCARRPDLLAVDHPRIAIPLCTGADARKVRASGRFGKELTPDFFTMHRLGHITLSNIGRKAMGEDRGNAHAKPDGIQPGWRIIFGFFLVEDDLLHRGAALAAHNLGPSDANIARLKFARLPPFGSSDRFGAAGMVAFGKCILIGFKPGLHLCTVGGFFGCIFEIHDPSSFLRLTGHHCVALLKRAHQHIGPM